jgi:hypothetical protein
MLCDKKLKEEWRENKEVVVDGVKKKLQFKKWLEHTGKDKDYRYLSMDTQRSEMTQLLNEKTDGFMIDTKLPQEVRDSILEASHAAKPLSAMDWTALPGSDDTVTFNSSRRSTPMTKKKMMKKKKKKKTFH